MLHLLSPFGLTAKRRRFALLVVLAFLWRSPAVIFEALPEGTCLDLGLREMRSFDRGDVELLEMVRWGDWLLEPAQPYGHAKEAIPLVILVPLIHFGFK